MFNRSYHKKRKKVWLLALASSALITTADFAEPAYSQDLGSLSSRTSNSPDARMLLAADEVIYDRDNNQVVAQGNVQIEYDGNKIVAERVTYNQETRRVVAQGNVEIVESGGNKIYSDNIDITDDLGEGFVESLRLESADNTRFAADSAERQNGQMTIFNRGIYTACEPCYDKPAKQVLWRVKAKKIIWNGETKTMRFEDSTFEMFGMPIGWFPVFEMPDPTVKRKTGLLTPNFSYDSKIGFGVTNSYFWNLAPNYDFTLSVTGFTKQGVLGEGEWRHRLETGSYFVRMAYINQLDRDAFSSNTVDRANDNRYMLGTAGNFRINDAWTYGWDILAQSDRNFSRTYGITGFSDSVHRSQLYLTGLSDRNYFDMRFYHFEVQDSMTKRYKVTTVDPDTNEKTTTWYDNENERHSRQPWVLPDIEYSFTPDKSIFGGELNFNNNLRVLYRDRDDYSYSDWQGNALSTPRLAGMGGTSGRLTSEVEWKRSFYANSGLVLTPILAMRGDLIGVHATDSYEAFNPQSTARGMATAGLEARYPILFTAANSTHIIEPTAQIFIRNNEESAGHVPNEDAQSFVFDATTLFQRDKFTGYDRVEGGSRANVGIRYSGNFDNGWSLYGLAGQSYQIGGRNSFQAKDFVSVGADSGLETTRSDYVAMLGATNENQFGLAARGRFDEEKGTLRRGELEVSKNWSRIWGSSQYAFIEAQPDYGYAKDRQEVSLDVGFKLTDTWSINALSSYDIVSSTLVRNGVGVNYLDECFGLSVNYLQTRNPWDNSSSTKYLFTLSFRTIGDFGK